MCKPKRFFGPLRNTIERGLLNAVVDKTKPISAVKLLLPITEACCS